MARATYVNKCRKANKTCGRCGHQVQVGEGYFYWQFRFGGQHVRCASCRPRQSELTSSGKMSRLYAIEENLGDISFTVRPVSDIDELKELVSEWVTAAKDALIDAGDEAREVGDEYRESRENMPEGLQDGEVSQQLEEAADSCDQWADELETQASSVESIDAEVLDDETFDEAAERVLGEIQDLVNDGQASFPSMPW